eukprot:CAMPEP_0115741792 /NCGR_PEP_ID=MMETSP0272-20121206/90189_1 /TAXON_ID=71861 /ORGANISM="Scrippsiella trochoidea, Strain CCMP3099" /LENGTH=90 /DNA_ID=CAMNT_0003186483 /DNA_START=284 /DNA_END=553 /DNA_ORIENTATION=-
MSMSTPSLDSPPSPLIAAPAPGLFNLPTSKAVARKAVNAFRHSSPVRRLPTSWRPSSAASSSTASAFSPVVAATATREVRGIPALGLPIP